MTAYYLAARYGRREELLGHAADLIERGHAVTSRWLAGDHQAEDLEAGSDGEVARWPLEDARRYAEEDVTDITAADVIISFSEPPRSTASRGGRHVEFGFVLGLNLALSAARLPKVPMVVVGPRENVFHCLPEVEVFPDWEAYLRWLDLDGLHRVGDVIRTIVPER